MIKKFSAHLLNGKRGVRSRELPLFIGLSHAYHQLPYTLKLPSSEEKIFFTAGLTGFPRVGSSLPFLFLNFTFFFFENLWEKEACSVINRAESLCLEKYLLMLFFLSFLDSSFFPFFLLPPFPPQPVGKCCSSSSSFPPLRHLRFPTHKRDKK